MELLESKLDFVRKPESNDRVHTRECCISFDTPKSEGGLFVDMNSFLSFGKDYVGWNYQKTGNPIYLHIEETQKPVSDGAEGGFDKTDPEYHVKYKLVILPDHVTISLPSEKLPPKVSLAVESVITKVAEQGYADWIANKKLISKHAMDLKQLDNGVIIPTFGWKCVMCDNTNNLWLNLTDGSIHCGRRNLDGNGGNNCGFKYYHMTKYPLAVKLGTISDDLEAADVFSYDEDATVLDPLLAQHLQHFGLDFSSLQKTELTTAEEEQNTDSDWNCIQESGEEVEQLFGRGYTGLVNLGNSSYLAAIMQVVFSTRNFCSRYYFGQSLQDAFTTAPADPTEDLNMQLTKLAHGLLSGRYSIPATKKVDGEESGTSSSTSLVSTAKQDGIPPCMFKSVISRSHPEFLTLRQQDALEFLLHFFDQVENINTEKPNLDPSKSFKFGVEEKINCSNGEVAYNYRNDYILSVNIPLHRAINKNQLGKLKAGKILRPIVPLSACLEYFSSPVQIRDFYSTASNAKTTAMKTAGLTSFPDYLVIHVKKFVVEGRVPRKLDVNIDVPDTIDISHMRSTRHIPADAYYNIPFESLPDSAEEEITADEDTVLQLTSMGFTYRQSQNAAINTYNSGIQAAMNWLLNHMDDPDPDDSDIEPQQSSVPYADPSKVDTLVSLGFDKQIVTEALQASAGDIEGAAELILKTSNPPSTMSFMDVGASTSSAAAVDDPLSDREGNIDYLELEKQHTVPYADPSKVDDIISFGFEKEAATQALQASGNDVAKAVEWIINFSSTKSDMDLGAGPSSSKTAVDDPLSDDETSLIFFPDTDDPNLENQSNIPSAGPSIVDTITSFGHDEGAVTKVLQASGGDMEKVTEWILNLSTKSDMDVVAAAPSGSKTAGDESLPDTETNIDDRSSVPCADPSKVDTSKSIDEDTITEALQASGGDIEKANEWLFYPSSTESDMVVDATEIANISTTALDDSLPDGEGRYRLMGVVSHIGSTKHSGHYVAHIYKQGKWVLFNDEQVVVSNDPPLGMGYLYFFERINT